MTVIYNTSTRTNHKCSFIPQNIQIHTFSGCFCIVKILEVFLLCLRIFLFSKVLSFLTKSLKTACLSILNWSLVITWVVCFVFLPNGPVMKWGPPQGEPHLLQRTDGLSSSLPNDPEQDETGDREWQNGWTLSPLPFISSCNWRFHRLKGISHFLHYKRLQSACPHLEKQPEGLNLMLQRVNSKICLIQLLHRASLKIKSQTLNHS